MAKKTSDKIVALLEEYFTKLPPISTSAREAIVQYIPWFALIFGILGLVSVVMSLSNLSINLVLVFIVNLLLVASYQGLKARKYAGWNLLVWSGITNLLASIVGLSLIGFLWAIFGLYLIFQIKSYYK